MAFWKDFVSNLLATLVGVVVGIPVALWIATWQERSTESTRKRRILILIWQELLQNYVFLNGWVKSRDKDGEARIASALIRTESWRAFSDGGELQWIKDPELLDTIAEAYSWIGAVEELSRKYLTIVSATDLKAPAANHMMYNFGRAVEEAILRIDQAFPVIQQHNPKVTKD